MSSDDAVLEPLPGEVRLSPRTRLTALFAAEQADAGLIVRLATSLGLPWNACRRRAWQIGPGSANGCGIFTPCVSGGGSGSRRGTRLSTQPMRRHRALDPGLAFGTGTHPSTALCLAGWMARRSSGLHGHRLRLRLGRARHRRPQARRAVRSAFDLDPQALLATSENAADDDVGSDLRICEDAQQLPQQCDVMVANILSETLVALAPALAAPSVAAGSCCWPASSRRRSLKWQPATSRGLIWDTCRARRLGRARRPAT